MIETKRPTKERRGMDFNQKEFEEWLFSDDIDLYNEGEYIVDENAKAEYISAMKYAKKLCISMQGKCSLKIDNPNMPYQVHSITITWDLSDYVEIPDTDNVREALKGMNLLLADDHTWMISKKICKGK